VGIFSIEGTVYGVLMIMNGLNITLVIELVIELRV